MFLCVYCSLLGLIFYKLKKGLTFREVKFNNPKAGDVGSFENIRIGTRQFHTSRKEYTNKWKHIFPKYGSLLAHSKAHSKGICLRIVWYLLVQARFGCVRSYVFDGTYVSEHLIMYLSFLTRNQTAF